MGTDNIVSQYFHTIVDSITFCAQERPEQQALTCLDAAGQPAISRTYAGILSDMRLAAFAWQQKGVQPGDVVLLALEHDYDLVAGFLGAIYAGAVPVILPYPRAGRVAADTQRVLSLIDATQATAVFATPAVTASTSAEIGTRICRTHAFTLEQAAAPPAALAAHERPDDALLYLQLTSGTTGTPKLSALSQRAAVGEIQSYAALAWLPDDIVVSWMPFHHDQGLVTSMLMPLMHGILSVSFSPAHWVARPELLFAAIHTYRGTLTFLPNFALSYTVRRIKSPQPGTYDLSCLRRCIVAAELVSQERVQGFVDHFRPWGIEARMIRSGWGMAEQVYSVCTALSGQPANVDWVSRRSLRAGHARPVPAGDADARAVICVGPPIPGAEIRVTDPERSTLPDRQVGEVLVRSPYRFDGYYGRPDLTAKVMHNGWYCSGDLGYLVGDELFIMGRKDDLIIVGGENIEPQAIEEIALAVLGPHGRLAVAFGLDDETTGTQKAVLVCEIRDEGSQEQITLWRAEIPRRVYEELDLTLADMQFVPKGWVIQSDAKIGRAANREKYLAEIVR